VSLQEPQPDASPQFLVLARASGALELFSLPHMALVATFRDAAEGFATLRSDAPHTVRSALPPAAPRV